VSDICSILLVFHIGERHTVDAPLIWANQLVIQVDIASHNSGDQLVFLSTLNDGIHPLDLISGSLPG
jgi:hypothetical protein